MNNSDLIVAQGNDTDLNTRLATKKTPRGFPVNLTMSSTALPNVALSSPPRVWPRGTESSSVAKLNNEASGMIAKKLRRKTAVGAQPTAPAMIPKGTNIKSTLT